jgi:hypothetical protein
MWRTDSGCVWQSWQMGFACPPHFRMRSISRPKFVLRGEPAEKITFIFKKKSISKWHAQLEVIHPEAIKTGTFTAIEKITQVISRQILYCCCCILEVYCQRLRAYLVHLIKLLLHAYKLSSTKFSMTTVHEFGGAEKISHRGIRTRP